MVNHDDRDGTASDPLVWSAGALPRGVGWFMRFGTVLFCPGHLVFGIRNGFIFLHLPSVLRILLIGPKPRVSWSSGFLFLRVSTGLLVVLILGVGGISYVELLNLYELWAGERLSLEKAHPRYLRPGRPISVSAVPFGPGIDIWRSCRFIGALMRSLGLLPGELHRFVPCSIGANHCRLRHIGWEKCGHGLTSGPRESASEPFLNVLLGLFRYPPGSRRALLAGTLPLWYCAARFACRTPTWRLPVSGHVVDLVTASVGAVREAIVDGAGQEVHWVSGPGPGRKNSTKQKNSCTPRGVYGSLSSTRLEEVVSCGTFQCFHSLITKGGVVIRLMGSNPAQVRAGVG